MEASNIEKLRNIMDNISRLNDKWFDTFPTDEGQTGIHDALMYEVMEANKILAAPTRNCDRFSNANEALEAFENEKRETIIEFIRWLFAEVQGGAK